MRSVFFIKMNNAVKKLREEDLPVDVPADIKEVICIVAFTFGDDHHKVPVLCRFKRIQSELSDCAMFMYDADSSSLPLGRGPMPLSV